MVLTRKVSVSGQFSVSLVLAVALALTTCSLSCGEVTGNSSGSSNGLASGARLMLRDGWQVQTSTGQPEGAAISKAGFAASGWYPTVIPATVSGVLAQAGVYPDPFVGTNLRDWPGMGRGGRGRARSGTPQSNPFSVPWWFRTEFDLPADMAGRAITLHLEGVSYRADVWLNGQRIADTNQVAGAMRRFALDITKVARPGQRNALAMLIRPSRPRTSATPGWTGLRCRPTDCSACGATSSSAPAAPSACTTRSSTAASPPICPPRT